MTDPPPALEGSDELSPLDYLLHRGEAHPGTRSAFLGVELLDQPADWARLREAMDRASRVVIRMRQKVVVPPVPITAPRWVVDPDFDLDYHLRRIALPAPGTLRQLLDLAEVTLASPLDTSRPLWEVVYVEGLEGGSGARAALLSKFSHAITDGLGGIALFEQVYDTERDPAPRPMPPLPIPRDVTGTDLVRASLRRLPETALAAGAKRLTRAADDLGRLLRAPGPTVAEAVGFAGSARRVLGPPPVPPSPLLRRRSLVSRTHVLEVPLADLRAAAKAVTVSGGLGPAAAGGQASRVGPPGGSRASVNDAYLAALSGGLGRYHQALGVPLDELPLALPVSLRTADDPAAGNRITGVTIAAPVGEPDPAQRIRLVREQVIARRAEPALDVLARIAPVLSRLPDAALETVTARITPPDVQASNVPGYGQETFLAGARVDRQYGIGPLPRVAMMAVLISRAGICTLTVRYDTASFIAPDELEKGLQLGLDEVIDLGRPRRTRPAQPGRRTPRSPSGRPPRRQPS
jgi:diacylglycerol O-acyltransferase / wax synthase